LGSAARAELVERGALGDGAAARHAGQVDLTAPGAASAPPYATHGRRRYCPASDKYQAFAAYSRFSDVWERSGSARQFAATRQLGKSAPSR